MARRSSHLPARSGMHRTHISLVEPATREPRLTTICTLAAALHVNPGDLLPVLFLADATSPTTRGDPSPSSRI